MDFVLTFTLDFSISVVDCHIQHGFHNGNGFRLQFQHESQCFSPWISCNSAFRGFRYLAGQETELIS